MSSYCLAAQVHPLLQRHHDLEHGFPVESDDRLFEYLLLEINQAGLSWLTVIKKRATLRAAYAEFSVENVARFGPRDIARLLQDAGVVRHRLKIEAAVFNARKICEIASMHGSFKTWLDENHPLEREAWVQLFRRTFRFVGKEIVGEFLTGTGYLPSAHARSCPVYARVLASNPPWARRATKLASGEAQKTMKESRAHFARFMRRRWLSLPRWFWSVMLAQGIVRFALMLPHGLLHDEAYYWFWGQELQLSYYENAPGTGWFLAPFLWLFGDEAWVMRLAAGLFGLFATYCAARLVCDLLPAHGSHLRSAADEKAEDEALQRFSVFVLATIIFWGLFSFWTHDVGCTAFAFFGIWMTVRALKDGRTRWWLLAGAGLGLSLLGKYTAALWIAASALFVLWDVEARRSLRRFAPWSALLVVLLALLPDLVWNHRNGWASFHFVSYRHLNTSDLSLQERMLNLLEYAATIVVAVGIPFCFVLVRSVRASKRWWNGLPVQQRYVFFVSACVLGFFATTAWKKGVYINWAVFPAMLFAIGCVALGSAGWRGFRKPLVLLAMLPSSLVVALYAASMLSAAWMPKGTFDQIYGWDEVYETITTTRRDSFPQHAIGGQPYQIASKLAHSACLEGDCNLTPEITIYDPSQFHYTYPSLEKWRGKNFLLLMRDYIRKEEIGTLFCSIVLVKEAERRVAGKAVEKFKIYDARHFLGRKGVASSCPP